MPESCCWQLWIVGTWDQSVSRAGVWRALVPHRWYLPCVLAWQKYQRDWSILRDWLPRRPQGLYCHLGGLGLKKWIGKGCRQPIRKPEGRGGKGGVCGSVHHQSQLTYAWFLGTVCSILSCFYTFVFWMSRTVQEAPVYRTKSTREAKSCCRTCHSHLRGAFLCVTVLSLACQCQGEHHWEMWRNSLPLPTSRLPILPPELWTQV